MEASFTADHAWSGGSLGLLLFLGRNEESRLQQAVECLWTHPSLEGCWASADREPSEAERITEWNPEGVNRLHGIATLPNGRKCPCSLKGVIDKDGEWIYFGTPLGSLGSCYEIGAYPFEDGLDTSWLVPLSEWLAAIGRHVFAQQPFRAGAVGFMETIEEEEILSGKIPAERWIGYLRNERGQLAWYPPNQLAAPFKIGRSP